MYYKVSFIFTYLQTTSKKYNTFLSFTIFFCKIKMIHDKCLCLHAFMKQVLTSVTSNKLCSKNESFSDTEFHYYKFKDTAEGTSIYWFERITIKELKYYKVSKVKLASTNLKSTRRCFLLTVIC